MRTCISTFIYAAVLLMISGVASDVMDHHPSAYTQFAEMPNDWQGEAGETEDDTAFEDDFAHSDVVAFCPVTDFLNGLIAGSHPNFNEHFGEIPSPPPQA